MLSDFNDFDLLKHQLPDHIKIGGVNDDLDLVNDYAFLSENKDESNDGEFNVNKGTIKIATRLRDSDNLIDKSRTLTVLLHEIFHGVVYHYIGDSIEDEEHIVTQMAKGVYQILVDNPELTKMFIE